MEMKPRILLADDDEAFTVSATIFLEQQGFAVEVVSNGEEALSKLRAFEPAVIVADVKMPLINGAELVRALRHVGSRVPVILLSNYGDNDELAIALHQGAEDFLNKPFKFTELVARILRVLCRPSD